MSLTCRHTLDCAMEMEVTGGGGWGGNCAAKAGSKGAGSTASRFNSNMKNDLENKLFAADAVANKV